MQQDPLERDVWMHVLLRGSKEGNGWLCWRGGFCAAFDGSIEIICRLVRCCNQMNCLLVKEAGRDRGL